MSDQSPNPPSDGHGNRPGWGSIRYRVGTHGRFKQNMLRALSSIHRPGLEALNTRDDRDFTIALLDAWAASADVLSFYQERIANEAYLRTAKERLSIRQLARLIGYELRPGKAASAHLAFDMEDAKGAPESLVYDAALAVKSVPNPDEAVQTFETIEPLIARPEWNAIRPRMTHPQVARAADGVFIAAGVNLNLKTGDAVTFVKNGVPETDGGDLPLTHRVTKAAVDAESRTTRVDLRPDERQPKPYIFIRLPLAFTWTQPSVFTTQTATAALLSNSWNQAALTAQATTFGFQRNAITTFLRTPPVRRRDEDGIQVFRVQAPLFAHNRIPATTENGLTDGPTDLGADTSAEPAGRGQRFVYLDNVYDEITEESRIILRTPNEEAVTHVKALTEISREKYDISARVTRLTIVENELTDKRGNVVPLSKFDVRETTVLAAPEKIELAELPIETDVGNPDDEPGPDTIELDGPYRELAIGQTVVLSGERADLAGVTASEVLEIADNTLNGRHAVIRFTTDLVHRYLRGSVTINGNVALATHGETKVEVLGSGDSTRVFQSFALKHRPLTYVTAATPTGAASTLELRVDGVLWTEIGDFRDAGPDDRVYVIRHSEAGETFVVFGDGKTGARLPTGAENVVATYRMGSGLEGLLDAGQLSLLGTKPMGVRGVSNPLPTAGAEDGEVLDDARRNAPLTVTTLDRIVSLQDYEDFARAFAGIAKARADWIWVDQRRAVFVTVAGPAGTTLPPDGPDMANLRAAMIAAGDPAVGLTIRNYRPAFFLLDAAIKPDPAYVPADVVSAAEARLREAFRFDLRAFGQGVTGSEVIGVIQDTPGVVAVTIRALHRSEGAVENKSALPAALPRRGARAGVEAAELLLLDPRPVILGLMS